MRALHRDKDEDQRPPPPPPPPRHSRGTSADTTSAQAPADFFSSLAVLGRRWKVVGAGLAVTLLVAFAAMTAIPPTYKANGSSFFAVAAGTAPSTSTDGVAKTLNPYLAFGGSLKVTAELMAKAMNGEQMQQQVADRGGSGHYVADLAPGDAPVLTLSATGDSPAVALKTEQMATQVLQDELKNSQIDLGASSDLIRTKEVLVPERASKQQTSRIRALIGVLVLGLGATVMAAFVVESISQHRAKNRLPRPVESEGEVRPLAGRRNDHSEAKADLGLDAWVMPEVATDSDLDLETNADTDGATSSDMDAALAQLRQLLAED